VSDEASSHVFVEVADLPPGGVRTVDAGGRQLLVCFANGDYYALENRCPHAAAPLDGGRLSGFALECPLHGGKLDVRDGSPQGHPIRRAAITFPVQCVDGGIEIRLD
jgi:nitrite reductase/ring-hydroxylating ferredoxin subunit